VDFVIYILSIWALVGGANFAVVNLELLTFRFNMPKSITLVIFIAFGYSLPEIINSIMANIYSRPTISISNFVGSNIFNMALALPIVVIFSGKNLFSGRKFSEDISWIFLTTSLFLIVSMDGKISSIEALFMLSVMGLYISSIIDKPLIYDEDEISIGGNFSIFKSIFFAIVGVIFMVVGSYFVVESSISIGSIFKLSNWNLGIFIALSTTIPKIVLILHPILKGKSRVAVAGIFNSTLANLTVGVGITGTIKDIYILGGNIFDFTILLFVTVMVLVAVSNRVYSRPLSVIFLGISLLFLVKSWSS